MSLQKVYVSKSGYRIFFSMYENRSENYSLRVLKRRLRQSKIALWNVFMHLTYNNENIEAASGQDIRRLMNKIKQYNRNAIRKYQKRENKKYIDEPRYKRWTKIYAYWKGRNQNFVYCWKLEFDSTGVREWNPHFHIIMSSPFYISKQYIQKWWGKGFVEVTGIYDDKKAKRYVTKYFSKDTSKTKRWKGKHWGHSRNLPKDIKKWTYEGLIDAEAAYKITKMQKQEILYGYKLAEQLKDIRKIRPVFHDYSTPGIRKDQIETLKARNDRFKKTENNK